MRRLFKASWILLLVVFCLALGGCSAPLIPELFPFIPKAEKEATPPPPAPSAESAFFRAESPFVLQDCGPLDEDDLAEDLERIATEALETRESAVIDLPALVEANWRRVGMDRFLALQVRRAVKEVKGESKFWTVVISPYSKSAATELTEEVTARTFGSDEFKLKIREAAAGVAEDLTARVRDLSAETATATILCLHRFLEKKYLAAAAPFEDSDRTESERLDPEIDDIFVHQEFISDEDIAAKVAILIGRQIAAEMAKNLTIQMAQDIGAEVAAQMVPVAGWVLAALTVYNSLDGAFPTIEEGLTSDKVKGDIKAALAASFREKYEALRPGLAPAVAENVFRSWRRYERRFGRDDTDLKWMLEESAEEGENDIKSLKP